MRRLMMNRRLTLGVRRVSRRPLLTGEGAMRNLTILYKMDRLRAMEHCCRKLIPIWTFRILLWMKKVRKIRRRC